MAFIFKNEKAARAIFEDWRQTYGAKDKDEIIKISMIRGVSEENPGWYRAVVTTNLDTAKRNDRYIMVSRVRTLEAESTENLDRFSESFKQFGFYLLAPAILENGKPHPKVLLDFGIVKTAFNDRQAWEIGPNDLDIAAITDDTKPIIPKNVKNAPLIELLKKRKTLKDGRHPKF